MITDIDDVLRKLLERELPITDHEVDIAFDQPKREWSSRLSKPTLNLFLFDLRENLRLRGSEQNRSIARPDGITEVRRNPVRMDLRYLMTAWVKEPDDEHLLLANSLMALLRNPLLPQDLLNENLQHQPTPILMDVASFPPEIGPMDKFSEIWGVLDNEMRPGIIITITLSMDPYRPLLYPQVRTRQTRFVQDTGFTSAKKNLAAPSPSKTYWSAGGSIKSDKYSPASLTVVCVETKQSVEPNEEGKFMLHHLTEGEYHVDILYNQKVLKRQKIQVPSPDYEILV